MKNCKNISPPIRKLKCALAGAILAFALSPSTEASLAWGSLNNFDAVNDTGVECHGFEIEIEGIHSRDISYTYDWNHYGVPKITEDNSNPALPRVFVRYESAKDASGNWIASTIVPLGPIAPTDGHQFTNPNVNFGGEHFGVGFFGAPSAVKYSWLKDDGTGKLTFAGAVNIATPTFVYNPPPAPAAPAQVIAAIVPPPPPEAPPVQGFGPASWVKDTKTTSHNNNKIELRDLVSDDPDNPDDRNWKNGEPDEVETEWRLLQREYIPDEPENVGKNGELEGLPEDLPNGDEIVTRRYDFFKYVGPIDAESGEAMADEVAPDGIHGVGIVSYNDHFDPATGEWVVVEVDLSKVVVVGEYIGAQMAGFDPGAQIGLIDHLQDGERNVQYVDRTMVIGGTAPIETTMSGALPDGMEFNVVTGVLSGTPTVSGLFTFELHSTDAAGGDVTKSYVLSILEPAIVEPAHITVSTSSSPSGGGTTTGDGEYAVGSDVTVSAQANAGYTFVNWTDGGTEASANSTYQFKADVNRELIANFAVITYTIATSSSPAAGGNTSGGGTVNHDDSVTVVATANPGYNFANWTEAGVVVSGSASYSFTAGSDRDLVANFTPIKRGDINNDGSIDSTDLWLILGARNKPASGPDDPRDLDHDGKITVLDARIEALLINQAKHE